jgi:hypothetical protein
MDIKHVSEGLVVKSRLDFDDQFGRPAIQDDQPSDGVIRLGDGRVVDEYITLSRIPPAGVKLIDESRA